MFKKYSIAIILVSFMLLSTSVINGKALNFNKKEWKGRHN